MTTASPLWPNPAPRGPIALVYRTPGNGRINGFTTYRLGDNITITITIMDGEPMTDILNRVYALGRLMGQADAFLEMAEQTVDRLENEIGLRP